MFAGQRLEGFYVDLGAIFDLGDLRPFEKLHIGGMANSWASTRPTAFGVHTIALKVPMRELTRSGTHADGPDVTATR